MTLDHLTQLKQRLAERTGLDLELLNRPALASYVERRRAAWGLADDAAYYARAIQDSSELEHLVQQVSVSETWFFRYPASYQLLIDFAAGLLNKQSTLKMLSVACATGEEPYSMAMAAAAANWPLERVAVEAIDRNEAALDFARQGLYRRKSFRDVTPVWAERWFRAEGEYMRVVSELRARVNFSRQDAMKANPADTATTYDVVFCRNLIIYLSASARAKLVDQLLSLLKPEGLLFIGHAEYSTLPADRFESADVKHAFAVRRRSLEPVAPAKPRPARTLEVRADVAREPARKGVAPRRPRQPTHPPASSPTEVSCEASLAEIRAMADAGKLLEAIAALGAIATPENERAEFFELLGSAYLGSGQVEQARIAFNKALYCEPNNEAVLLQMAIVCDRLGHAVLAARFRRRAARAHHADSKSAR